MIRGFIHYYLWSCVAVRLMSNVFLFQVKLDLSMTYVGVPVTPEPSEGNNSAN